MFFHKRRHQRVKRRFACEFLADGQRYRGIIVELSRSGLFVQTDATTAPGTEIHLHLAGAGAAPDLMLRAVVVRRRMVPAPLASALRRGIALEILEAPREYGLACGPELLDAPIRLTRRGDETAGKGPARAPQPEIDPERATEEPSPAAEAARPAPGRSTPAARAGALPHAPQPDVLLIDDGTLGDVATVLRGLHADLRHLKVGPAGETEPFERPSRLFITTARLAWSLHLPDLGEDGELVAVAVAEDESQTLSTMMRRLGFSYLVHRPTHPEALRLLLRQILYRGAEKRRDARLPFGAEVAWRTGWRKQRGPMVEISASGCRLHSARGARPGSRIRIWIPPEATGDRRIVLRGRIARRDARPLGEPGRRYSLAVAFDAVPARMQRRLDALLARSAHGPSTLPRVDLEPRVGAPPPARAPREAAPLARPAALTAPEAPLAPVSPASPEPAGTIRASDDPGAAAGIDRRQHPRVRLEREVVALDDAGARALRALLGRDLSALGMRVDPHPDLALHQRLRLALYEPTIGAPVILQAEVARDDGAGGFALVFHDVSPETKAGIARIVASLPALESLRPEPRRIVLGELLYQQPAA